MKQLAAALPANIQHLAGLIARKPEEYTNQWAATGDEAFSLYTRTSTVNLVLSLNDILAESGWPFPSFLNLREELNVRLWPIISWRLLWRGSLFASLAARAGSEDAERRCHIDKLMVRIFRRHQRRIFGYWLQSRLLQGKKPILKGIQATYQRGIFAACMPTLLPLLDFVMRDYFETNRLDASITTLRDAFDKAGILPKHLKPGYAILDAKKDPGATSLFSTIENDLRLPGQGG